MADDTLLEAPAGDPPADLAPPAPPPADPTAPPVSDPPAGDPAPQPPATDWRSDMAGEDKELLGFLGRYASKDAALKAFKKTNDDIKKGVYRKPLSDDPTPDEIAAYRKDFGVPDKPEGYLEKLPEGLVIGDDDRPMVESFLAKMHSANAPAAVTSAALDAYYELVDQQAAAESEANATAKAAGEDALRSEWGGDYRRNLNILQSHLSTLPEAVTAAITGGRGPDGIALANNPEIIKWLTGLALESNPVATVVPGAGANQESAIADEIATIERTMRENRPAYNRDEKMQTRYRELLTARERIKG